MTDSKRQMPKRIRRRHLLDIEFYMDAAYHHGEDYPDHEVGDLQDYLRALWKLTTPEQQIAFARSDEVRSCLAAATGLDVPSIR